MERYCPPGTARFLPANKISPKFKQVYETFLSPKLFSAEVKRFFGMLLIPGTGVWELMYSGNPLEN